MAELRGSLQDFGIVALVRFLVDSGGSGCLRITHGGWDSEIAFDHGRMVAVAIGAERGVAALELIALALADGDFVYTDRAPLTAPNIDSSATQLEVELERLLSRPARRGVAPLLRSIPRITEVCEANKDHEVAFSRSELALLLDIDGRRSTEDIIRGRELAGALYTLTRLSEVGVIKLEPADEPVDAHAGPPSAIRSNGPSVPNTEASGALNGSGVVATAVGPSIRRITEAGSSANGLPETEPISDGAQRAAPYATPTATMGTIVRRSRLIQDVVRVVVLTVLFAVGIRSVVQSVHVEGESMRPGLQNGQSLLINRAAYFHLEGTALAELLPDPAQGITRFMFGGPKRGDVVVFQASSAPDNELVKRIIGLPGESVRIEAGKVLVDNRLLDEPYTAGGVADVERYPSDGQPISVPQDSYFVLGDNRSVSLDSRLGWFVRVEELVGRAWLTYWPPTAWAVVPQPILAEIPQATPAPATSREAPLATPSSPPPVTPGPTLLSVPTAAPTVAGLRTLLQGALKDQSGWPDDPTGTAWLDSGQYKLVARHATRFVAVAAPVVSTTTDVIVGATFHKTGGPPGGGYGIVVRDQGSGPRDGIDQGGRFYVAVASDLGEVGLWRRESDHWVDLQPWTPSRAVYPGGTTNELTLRVIGQRLTFLVNGAEAIALQDAALPSGGVGAFVGGDNNQVVLDRFSVQLPPAGGTP